MATKPSKRDKTPSDKQHPAENRVAPAETADEAAKPNYLQLTERRAQEADDRIRQRTSEEERAELTKQREQEVWTQYSSNTTVQRRAAEVEANLQRLEGQGLFSQFPIKTDNKFPTLLTRIPLFPPSHRVKQREKQDIDTAVAFDTPFGSGKRYGPPLTTKEEDVFITLARLRSRRLFGRPESLPAGVSDIYQKSEAGTVGVHCTICSLTDILEELELSDAGLNYADTLQSIKRLGTTTLELTLNKHERYLGMVETGAMIPLIQVQWQVWKTNGLIFVIFPPVTAHWLDNEYTFIDWNVRRQLPPLGKAIHRFLSGQKANYQRKLIEVGTTIGYDGEPRNIKTNFRKQLDKLVEIGWLESYSFEGSARKDGLVLRTTKSSGKKKLLTGT